MGAFDLNGNNSGNNWNYSDPNKPGYMTEIQGTVVQINEVPSINYATKKQEFWADGNPKTNVAFTIQGNSGRELRWVFAPKSKAAEALGTALPQASNMAEFGGKVIKVTTQPGVYNNANPRPWQVQVIGDGQVPFRGIFPYTPQPTPVPAQVQQQVQQALNQQTQNDFAPTPAVQPVQQQPAQQQPVPTVTPDMYYADEDIPF